MTDTSAIARQRLYPSLRNPNYLVLRARRQVFQQWFSQLGNGLNVLDVGGRYQPYRPLLEDRIRNYLSVDLVQTELVGVVADGEALPFAPASFDLVIATQVFEYFPDPQRAARQVHQVLKPGGILLASMTAFAPRFAEEERWRFTAPGLRTLFAAFAQIEIVPELRSLGGVLRSVNLALSTFIPTAALRLLYGITACPALNLLGRGLESMRLTANDQFAANYSVRAVKGR